MSLLLRQAHGYKCLCSERVSLQDVDVQELLLVVAIAVFILVLIQVQVTPGAWHAHTRLVWSQIARRADKHVHDGFGRLLARREAIQIRHVGDIEVLGGRALIGGDSLGRRDAVWNGKLR